MPHVGCRVYGFKQFYKGTSTQSCGAFDKVPDSNRIRGAKEIGILSSSFLSERPTLGP